LSILSFNCGRADLKCDSRIRICSTFHWKAYEREYLMTKNPIVQAMIPLEKPVAGYKRATGPKSKVSFNRLELRQRVLTEPAKSPLECAPPASSLRRWRGPEPAPLSRKVAGNMSGDLWNFT
jgi:hypothetical protein